MELQIAKFDIKPCLGVFSFAVSAARIHTLLMQHNVGNKVFLFFLFSCHPEESRGFNAPKTDHSPDGSCPGFIYVLLIFNLGY